MVIIPAPAKVDDRQFDAWLLFFAAATVVSCAAILLNRAGGAIPADIAASLIAAIAGFYWVFARPSRAGVRRNSPRAWIYVSLAAPALIAAIVLSPWASIAMFLVSPQIFILFRIRFASVMFILLSIAEFLAQTLPGPYTWHAVWPNVVITVGIIVIAIFFNARISAISRESEARGALIEELRHTQSQIAVLSEEQGRSAERVRIAREMHDTLAQGFTSIVTLGHAVQRELTEDPDAAKRHVELMTLTAQENLQESRRIIAALSPTHLDDASLPEAIGRVVERLAQQGGASASMTLQGTAHAVSAAIDVVVLRVCQEALANVAKHANASVVSVALAYDQHGLTLTVTDDGDGFDPKAASAGYGLDGMRSRLSEVGGELTIRSTPEAGTTIEARVPVAGTQGESL